MEFNGKFFGSTKEKEEKRNMKVGWKNEIKRFFA